MKEDSLHSDSTILKRVLTITSSVCAVFYLEISILMNITKWVNYFLFLRIHRKIRYEEVYVEMMDCKVEDDYNIPSNQFKLQNLRNNFLS